MVQVRWTVAKIQVVKLRARTKILLTNPQAGKVVPEFSDANFRELIEGSYRIIYKIVDSKQIDILTIHHSARDLIRRQIE